MISQLIEATKTARTRLVAVSLVESEEQTSGLPALMSNISFPSTAIRQDKSSSKQNPGNMPMGYVKIRLKNVVVRYVLKGAHFSKNLLDETHLITEESNIEVSEEKQTRNTRTGGKDISLGAEGHIGSDAWDPIPSLPIGVSTGLSGKMSGGSKKEVNQITESKMTSKTTLPGRKFSRYGGYEVSFSWDNNRFEIEVNHPENQAGLSRPVFVDSVNMRALKIENPLNPILVKAYAFVNGANCIEIEDAGVLFECMKQKKKGRQRLFDRAMGKIVEIMMDEENLIQSEDFRAHIKTSKK